METGRDYRELMWQIERELREVEAIEELRKRAQDVNERIKLIKHIIGLIDILRVNAAGDVYSFKEDMKALKQYIRQLRKITHAKQNMSVKEEIDQELRKHELDQSLYERLQLILLALNIRHSQLSQVIEELRRYVWAFETG